MGVLQGWLRTRRPRKMLHLQPLQRCPGAWAAQHLPNCPGQRAPRSKATTHHNSSCCSVLPLEPASPAHSSRVNLIRIRAKQPLCASKLPATWGSHICACVA